MLAKYIVVLQNFYKNLRTIHFVAFLIILLGAWFRLYHIEFGLPHSSHADEPEITEFAIKYTYEIQDIVAKTELYRLTPISYVYGTFPAYFFTVVTMFYSKINGILGNSFEKVDIYIFLRTVNALITLIMIPTIVLIYKNLFSYKKKYYIGALFSAFFIALNWKLILHAHYLNVDIIITVLLTLSYLTFLKYLDRNKPDTLYTTLTAVLFGLAVGTKVTVALTLPLYLLGFLLKKEYRNIFAFLFIILAVFIVTNPFSISFMDDFIFRVYTLSVKENGLVFDSVDSGFFKYFFALTYITTPLVTILAAIGIYFALDEKNHVGIHNILVELKEPTPLRKHLFLLGTIVIYLAFFTIGSRRVDRWLLPLLPIMFIYASYILNELFIVDKKIIFFTIVLFVLGSYLYFPLLMLWQFDAQTPKSAAYLWMRDNLDPAANKLVITEEGLDPMNKLQSTYVLNYQVYESENAQYRIPESPVGYDYIVLASRPMQNFKRPEVANRFPFYSEAWYDFENTLQDESKYKLIKVYELPKPNLIEVSDVYIYESVVPVARKFDRVVSR